MYFVIFYCTFYLKYMYFKIPVTAVTWLTIYG